MKKIINIMFLALTLFSIAALAVVRGPRGNDFAAHPDYRNNPAVDRVDNLPNRGDVVPRARAAEDINSQDNSKVDGW